MEILEYYRRGSFTGVTLTNSSKCFNKTKIKPARLESKSTDGVTPKIMCEKPKQLAKNSSAAETTSIEKP